jgi:hypothetical protein
MVTRARIDPCQTPTILEPCLRRTAKSVPVVFDDEVQPTSDKPELDSGMRGCGVAMNVGQALLHYSQQRALQFVRKRVAFCMHAKVNVYPSASRIPFEVLLQS